MKKLFGLLAALVLQLDLALCFAATTDQPLTTLDYHVVGLGLQAGPEYQAVPKGIQTQVTTGIDAQGFDVAGIIAQLPKDYRVKAELTGPAFLTPKTLETLPGRPFDIPTLALLGKHTLNNIRLVDGSGKTLFGAMPQAVIIESINDPLITEVKTRQLTLEELQERGVTFDSSNFTAYEFTAGIATESGQVPIKLPVIIPTEQRLVNPEDIPPPPSIGIPQPTFNQKPPEVENIKLPPNLTVAPFMMTIKEPMEGTNVVLPPIPGVVVIPGNIGFLHQYFSALALVTNGAPTASNLLIRDIEAKIVLPPGADLTPGTDAAPGDDPLRLAKGAGGYFPRQMPVLHAGPDGKAGTADDISRLAPAETGQADFTIEGLKEGTHPIEFEITATLDGLPIGPVTLTGLAKGAVLVRNPDFALTMSHPATVRSGEGYDLFLTVTNTGKSVANLVSVHLDPRAISGAALAEGEEVDKEIETILPGSSATVRYRLVSQRTGAVTATTFESEEVKGRFNLRTGVGERGIPLSPDSLILPYIGDLSADLVDAAVGLLGQAWSVATAPAGALPADVLPIAKSVVTDRAYDLSEAGLRLLIGDAPVQALEDFTFDFYGSDRANLGFDDLRRHSTQGLKLNRALAAYFRQEIDAAGLLSFQADFADKVAYRPGHLSVVTGEAPVRVRLGDASGQRLGGLNGGDAFREIPYADQFLPSESAGLRSTLSLVTVLESSRYALDLLAESAASLDLGIVLPDASGVLRQWRFEGVGLSAGARATATLRPGSGEAPVLVIDDDADGNAERTVAASSERVIPDRPPRIVAATQIVPGFGPGGDKHGRNVAVLFSERVTAATAKDAANYAVDANRVKTATVQPGGRMAFLLLRDGIGPFFERSLTVDGLTDTAGQPMSAAQTLVIRTTASGPAAVVDGVVREANGAPVAGAKLSLQQLIWYDDGFTIESRYAIFSEKEADENGAFHFDYVLQNRDPAGPFRLEAVHPATGEAGQLTTGVNFHGQRLGLDIFMKARGSLSGRVLDAAGNPVAGASVLVSTLNDGRGFVKTTDATGAFAFAGLSVGAYRLKAVHSASLSEGLTMGTLPEEGGAVAQDVTIYPVSGVPRGDLSGKVLAADGKTPRGGVIVIVKNGTKYQNWTRSDADGGFFFPGVYAGAITIEARDDDTGERIEVKSSIAEGTAASVNLLLPGAGTVGGTVARGDGKSVADLYVIATFGPYTRLTRTDAGGRFTFDTVAVGQVIVKVLDPNDFNRQVASEKVTLLSDGEIAEVYLFVPDQALAVATLRGTVYHRDGTPWSGAQVRLTDLANWTYYPYTADGQGRYEIPGLALNKPHSLVVIGGSEVINATTTLWYGGQVKTVDLHPFAVGTVTGTTWDDAEKTMPTGADVSLKSMKPDPRGWLVFDSNHPTVIKSDPQTGRFTFPGVYQGNFTVSSSNIFRPVPVSAGGTISANGQTVNVELTLKGAVNPDTGEVEPVNTMGSISGRVLLPSGDPAGAGVRLTTSFGGAEVTVTTDEDGYFQFSPIIPQGNRPVVALDPVSTLTWKGYVVVAGGKDVVVNPRLLGRGTLVVRALNADATPAPGTVIEVKGSAFPNDLATGTTGPEGTIAFANLSQGSYAVSAQGSFGRGGRAQGSITADGATVAVDVYLAPSATVTGTFFKADGKTPIAGGQIKLLRSGQVLAYANSSSDPASPGQFRIDYVPLGDFTLEGYDPTTERLGRGAGRLVNDGETIAANVTVIPQGTVRGTVLNHSGTAPVEKASVRISTPGYNYTAATGPDGGYLFAGVPAGRFDLEGTDPANGLKGKSSGSVTYEGETVDTEIRIAPTGIIEGEVLMPDGTTPAGNSRVVFQGKSVLVDPATGAFRFDQLALGSYSLSAYELNTHRAGTAIVTLGADGEVAPATVILRGIGSVAGIVYDTDGATPLSGAKVRLTAKSLVNADYTVYSDGAGAFRFTDVPVGTFSLQVSHPQRVTAAAASGTLQSEGQEATVNLLIGPVASVTGTVFHADGETVAAAGGVQFTGCGRTFNSVIDSEGRFLFDSIPVPCDFSLYLEDADGTGIGRHSGSLAINGELHDIGTIVLDDQPIAVVQIDPAPGTVNVPVTASVRLLFSEPARPGTITNSTVKLLKGGVQVPASLLADADGRGATITAPLQGLALYTVVVTTGLQDRVYRPLPATFTSTFTTVDNVPPALQTVSPADGAVQVAPDAVVRLTFSEAIDPAFLDGIVLRNGSAPVACRLDLLQGGTVAALTPHAPLLTNALYTLSVSGVRDMVGNLFTGTRLTTFKTLDTIPPTVTALSVPPSAKLIRGLSVTVTAEVADSDVALVDFFADGVRVATDTSAPYTFALPLLNAGPLQLHAIAQDQVGNRGAAFLHTLEVAADQPPTAAILAPAEGVLVNNAGNFTVRVEGRDDIAVKEITLAASGAMTFSQTRTVNGTPVTADFTLSVPAGAEPGSVIVLSAVSRDGTGQASGTVQRTVTVRDGLAPTLSLSSAGQTVRYAPGAQGSATATLADNIGVTAMNCSASGAATGSQSFTFDPALAQGTQSFTFTVFASANPHAQATIACTAYDGSGNSVQKSIVLQVADTVSPQVVAASIPADAVDVPINAVFTFNFDEPLAAATVNAASVLLIDSSGQSVVGMVALSADRRTITFTPASTLVRGVTYTLTIVDSIADDAGNVMATAFQRAFTTDATAPAIVSTSPVDGSQNVLAGSSVSIAFSESLLAASITAERFVLTSDFGPVPGTLALTADGKTVTFKPLGQLGFNRDYTMEVLAGIEDISGNAIAGDYQFTFRTKAPDSDLVALWAMDGEWKDSSGNDNHGVGFNGATFSTDKVSGTSAALFDGQNDYFAITNPSSSLSIGTNSWTISAWVKPADNTTSTMSIVSRYECGWHSCSALDGNANSYYKLGINSKGLPFFGLRSDTSSSLLTVTGQANIKDGKWHHLAGVLDREGNNILIFVDGQESARIPATEIGPINDSGSPLSIGRYYIESGLSWGPSTEYFNGLIDEVAIYKRALYKEDIFEIYNYLLTGDREPPAPPVVEHLPPSTFCNNLLLMGSKEIGTSIRVNGTPVVAHNQSTGWQTLLTLNVGQNILELTSRDAAGNESQAVTVSIHRLPANQRDPDIVGLWHMDGNWLDSSGNGNHASGFSGAGFSTDSKVGLKAGNFPSLSDYFMVQNVNNFPTDEITFGYWVKSTNTAQNGATFSYAAVGGHTNELTLFNTSNLHLWLGGVDFGNTGISVNDGLWHHVALSWRSADGQLRVYKDGVLGFSKVVAKGDRLVQGGTLVIGQDQDTVGGGFETSQAFQGLIDEVQIFKRALSAEEIEDLFDSTPRITLASTGQTVSYRPGETGTAEFTVTHSQEIEKVICTASGAASGQLVLPLPSLPVTDYFEFVVDANAGPDAPMALTCSAIDSLGNVGTSSLHLTVADVVRPRVIGSSIQNDAGNVPGTVTPTISFDESLAADSVNAATVTLRNTYTSEIVSGTVTLSPDRRSITFQPIQALQGATAYELSVTTDVTDTAGNGLAQDYVLRFTTQLAEDLTISGKGTASAPFMVATGRYGDIAISGSYVVFDGLVAADTLSLSNGAVLTHTATGLSGAERLEIQANDITIDATSRIDVSGRGYLGGRRGGNASDNGRTLGNTTTGGSAYYSGGSYGGLGGVHTSSNGLPNAVYGDMADPDELGSGGAGTSSTNSNYWGGNGGGLVRIVAGTLSLDGSILADGMNSSYRSGGSGGGIRIEVGTLSGSGTIRAKGGNNTSTSYAYCGGGGGRIAIHYETMTLPIGNISATGGQSSNNNASRNGGAGTVWLKGENKINPDLILDNRGLITMNATSVPAGEYASVSVRGGAVISMSGSIKAATDLVLNGSTLDLAGALDVPGDLILDGTQLTVGSGLTISGDLVLTNSSVTVGEALSVPGNLTLTNSTLTVSGSITTNDLTLDQGSLVLKDALTASGAIILKNGSFLSHYGATISSEWKLDIQAPTSLFIDATSRIDVSGRGYLGGRRGGNASDNGRTLGNTTDGGSAYYSGGSYGGLGGVHTSSSGLPNAVYGDLADPNELGSGGAGTSSTNSNYWGGNGGGLVRIVAGTLSLDGSILADGMNSSYRSGGSGGGIRIEVGTLSGSGTIRAKGGNNTSTSYRYSGGGGGRIALHYGAMTLPIGNISAAGGQSSDNNPSRNGGAGTIWLKAQSKINPDLVLENGGMTTTNSTNVPAGAYGSVTVAGGAVVSMGGSIKAETDLSLDGSTLDLAGALEVPGDLILDGTRLTVGGGLTVAGNLVSTDSSVSVGEALTVPGSLILINSTLNAFSVRTSSGLTLDQGSLFLGDNMKASGAIILTNGSLLSHYGATTSGEWRLDIQAPTSTFTIDATSKIDVTGRGYLGGYRSGNGNTGRTVGNTTVGGSTGESGGSYGGLGGDYSGKANAAYGSVLDPNELGSGGASNSSSSPGGNGGGLVRIVAQSIALEGQILADGTGSNSCGAGSGGGILLDVDELSGSGSIRANGGSNNDDEGAGGGGRIAIYYGTMTLPAANISAQGGTSRLGGSARNGGAGTVYLKTANRDKGDLIIDNRGVGTTRVTTVPGIAYASITVRGGAIGVMDGSFDVSGGVNVPGDLVLDEGSMTLKDKLRVSGAIMLKNGSLLSHYGATTSGEWRLDIQAPTSTITIDATSKIDVTGRGYLGGYQSGNGNTGRTVENSTAGGSTGESGGSYGGLGGDYSGKANTAYGNLMDPNELGSGGASNSSSSPGGNGGGLVRIVAQSIALEGQILADGTGSNSCGAGSGGGILLDVGDLSGNGSIRANGGNNNDDEGAGGGGRIAIYYDTMTLPAANISAQGGTSRLGGSARNGGAGTVYLKAKGESHGELIVDNRGIAVNNSTTPLRAVGRGLVYSITPSSLSVNTNRWTAGSLTGLRVKPNVNREELFTVIDNNATTLFTDPEEGDLSWWAPVGSTFSGVYRFDRMKVAGKARVSTGDMLEIAGELLVDDASLVSGGAVAETISVVNGGVISP